ncbi:hypothetical protein [uncultured Shewanella sp.]|uniref:hypothetical protein n=1 Tax=uncultured Shewanella sp. TaxID=173975 RepID=UPI002627E991|nr:hypothetical protein [uncultured Shewanella sp.]
MTFLQIKSRQKIDNAIFTFGTYDSEGETLDGYKVFCAGSGSHHLEWFMPLKGDKLHDLINNLKSLNISNYKQKIKIKSGWSNINLHFLGFKAEKGIKMKVNISGFLFYSGAFGSSYVTQSELDRLINNLVCCGLDAKKQSHY